MRFRTTTSVARPQPRHPTAKVVVATKKHIRLPKMSEKRPYNGWKAVLVTRYEVVSHEAVFAESKSELITAYVEAVIVLSKPYRKTFAKMASSIKKNPFGGCHVSSSGAFNSGVSSVAC